METIGAQYILKFSAAGSCAKGAKICSEPYFLVLQSDVLSMFMLFLDYHWKWTTEKSLFQFILHREHWWP